MPSMPPTAHGPSLISFRCEAGSADRVTLDWDWGGLVPVSPRGKPRDLPSLPCQLLFVLPGLEG